jgi:predicted transcriptional regulator
VFRFLKTRSAAKPIPFVLGPLELAVMEIVWTRPESNVRDVATRLDRPLAYTTVMTTLDRLFKKGLLDRQKSDRAFVYSAALSRNDWERKQAGDLVAGLLASPRHSSELLMSCLVDAVSGHDEALLNELERKIQAKRRENQRRKS